MPYSLGTPSQLTSTKPGTVARLILTVTEWTLIRFWKGTAGTIVIGDSSDITATVGGNGVSISSGETYPMLVAPGTNFYGIASTASEVLEYYTQSLPVIPLMFTLLESIATGKPPNQLTGASMPHPGQGAMKDFLAQGSPWKGRRK